MQVLFVKGYFACVTYLTVLSWVYILMYILFVVQKKLFRFTCHLFSLLQLMLNARIVGRGQARFKRRMGLFARPFFCQWGRKPLLKAFHQKSYTLLAHR